VAIRPRKGSTSLLALPFAGARLRPTRERHFEFIPLWGFLVFLLYAMRRLDCRRCGVVAVEVPCGDSRRALTEAYMLFLARWARRLSWKETAEAFRTSSDKIFDAVEHVVTWRLEHRTLGQIDAIGEEITSKIVCICSNGWEPSLKVISEKCSEALHILDRFHIVAK
jgi:transposase